MLTLTQQFSKALYQFLTYSEDSKTTKNWMKETYRKPPVLCWFFHENCQFFESSPKPGTGFFRV
jgi:hypothetical protein